MACKIDLKKLSKCTTIIGAFIISLPTGIPWFYGNLSPYLISYFRFQVGLETSIEDTDWIVPAFSTMLAMSLITLDFLVDKIGLRWMQVLAFLTFDLGMFLTYFTVQHSVGLTLMTFSGVCGLATGQLAGIALMYVTRTIPTEHVGVTSAFVSCGFGLGAVVINIIAIAYINPDNLTPNVREKNMAFFSQQRLIHIVPNLFLVIGTVGICLQFLGFFIEQVPVAIVNNKINNSLSSKNEKTLVKMKSLKDYNTNDSFKGDSTTKSTVTVVDISQDDPQTPVKEDTSFKPTEVLRSRSFYQIWICFAILSYSALVNANFNKLFGQLWIKDDSFLTSIVSVAAVSMSMFRIAFGRIIDKVGVKNAMMLALSLNAVLMSFWYITPRINRWFYFVFFQVLNGVHGSIYILFPMSALKLFGPKYYATNYGLITTALLVSNLLSPALFSILLEHTGWFGLIFVGGAGSALVLLSVMLVLSPEQQ